MDTQTNDMNRCAICGAKIESQDPRSILFLFHSEKTGREYYGCETCAKQLSRLVESSRPEAAKAALNYFTDHLESIEEPEVREHLSKFLESNANAANEPDQTEGTRKSIGEQKPFAEKSASEGTSGGWINGLRAFAWIAIIIGVVGGLIGGASLIEISPGVGVLVIGLCVVASFLSVGALMVFLDMAEDIRRIRMALEKRK